MGFLIQSPDPVLKHFNHKYSKPPNSKITFLEETPLFDPVKLAERVEKEVTRKNRNTILRKYWRFRSSRHYGGNNAADVVGCNLRCAFCWAWRYAYYTDKGRFYTPQEAAWKISRAGNYRIARLTGGEPTIGWDHTLQVIKLLVNKGFFFILETNGILIGAGKVEVKELPKNVHIRISIKAPDEDTFSKATGAHPIGWRYQLKALEVLLEAGFKPGQDFHAAVVMGVAPPETYKVLFEKLNSLDPLLIESIEPEYIVLYPHVVELMKKRKFEPYYAIKPG
jgi:uncharacterized Fe-S cluster-containing radical SAM superfamily protein